MPPKTQSFAKHTQWTPLFHFIAAPITTYWFFERLAFAVRHPSYLSAGKALVAFGIAVGVFVSRTMVISVQNRVIRLEMRLRLREILPGALVPRINELTVNQLVGLRFASDAEMPALVERVLKGEFTKQRDIKAAIKDWQPDFLRA